MKMVTMTLAEYNEALEASKREGFIDGEIAMRRQLEPLLNEMIFVTAATTENGLIEFCHPVKDTGYQQHLRNIMVQCGEFEPHEYEKRNR